MNPRTVTVPAPIKIPQCHFQNAVVSCYANEEEVGFHWTNVDEAPMFYRPRDGRLARRVLAMTAQNIDKVHHDKVVVTFEEALYLLDTKKMSIDWTPEEWFPYLEIPRVNT